MNRIFCKKCNSNNFMELHETVDEKCYCSCTKCNETFSVNEFSKAEINGKEYIFSATFDAYYRRCPITKRYFLKLGFTKKGDIAKKESAINHTASEYNYLDGYIA